jgi:hypothetical protein
VWSTFQPSGVVQLVVGYVMEVGWLLMSGNKRYLGLVYVMNLILNGVDTQHPKETGKGARSNC